MPRMLPAFYYDALKAGAAMYGGIGYMLMTVEGRNDRAIPYNAFGILHKSFGLRETCAALRAADLLDDEIDNYGMRELIRKLGLPDGPDTPWPRVTFKQWADHFNVERDARPEAMPDREEFLKAG